MEQTCSECDFDASDSPPREVSAALPQVARAICESVRAIDQQTIRRRPAPEVWSPLEYVGHLRESMAFHRWLIEKALTEDNPAIPMVDPDASVAAAGYASADSADLVAQFERRIQRLCAGLSDLGEPAVQRTLTLGGDQLSVGLIARSAWHECHHHLGDIRKISGLDPPPSAAWMS